MKVRSNLLFTLLFVQVFFNPVFFCENVPAENAPEMVTDRPDQTESSKTVLPGYVQIETGLTHTDWHGSGVTGFPGTLFRIGVSDRIEARLGFNGWIFDDTNDTNGFGDSELSAKIFLCEESGWLPETAILAGVSVPTGEEGFSSERVDPSVRVAFSHTLTDRLALGYNLAMNRVTETENGGDKNTLTCMPYTCGLGIGVIEEIGAYLEFFGEIPLQDDGDPAHLFNGGITFLIFPNFQLDLEGGVGISDKAEDWFIGTGLSFRLPQ